MGASSPPICRYPFSPVFFFFFFTLSRQHPPCEVWTRETEGESGDREEVDEGTGVNRGGGKRKIEKNIGSNPSGAEESTKKTHSAALPDSTVSRSAG